MAEIVNAFTVDVEDYFQVSAFDPHISRDQWDDFPCRVVANTHRILKLLDSYQVHGTFFVLGWVASRFPQLIKDIHRGGHEVASHGFWHRLIYSQTPVDFRSDVRLSRDTLEQIVGERVTAYRAPSFSITTRSLWALEILVEEGFTVDSSIFPIHHDRYGIPNAQTAIHELSTPAGCLCEAPPSVASIGGVRLPVGGGYFRLYPWQLSAACLRQINHRSRRPFIFYVHPWELDPEQPRLRVRKLRSRFRHYLNLHRTESRLHKLLQTFRLSSLRDVVGNSGVTYPDCSGTQVSAPLGANSNP
jgi:polysaccharide deacetylase family protein (PEP-CTERM system associated)